MTNYPWMTIVSIEWPARIEWPGLGPEMVKVEFRIWRAMPFTVHEEVATYTAETMWTLEVWVPASALRSRSDLETAVAAQLRADLETLVTAHPPLPDEARWPAMY